MTDLNLNLKWFQMKKVFALIMILCLCVTTVGIHADAAITGDMESVQSPGNGEQTPDNGEQTPDNGEQTPDNGTAVTSIYLNRTSASLKTGDSTTLTATIYPNNAANKDITWDSTDKDKVTITKTGATTATVKALKNGTSTITAKAGTKTAYCTVTVTTDPTSVNLSQTSLTLPKGNSQILNATVLPESASNKAVTWRSSRSSVVAVDNNGKVTARAKGTATITVTTANGKTRTCNVTVAEVKLNATKTTLQVGKSTTSLKIDSKYPSSDRVKSWNSSNKSVASVNSSSGRITAKKTGTATITVTMRSGATASCKVTVQRAVVKTASLKMSASSLTLLAKGRKATLAVTRSPITATEKITWTSSNTKVATVNSKGVVTARGFGTARITARTSNGKQTMCTVIVPRVTLKATRVTLKVNRKATISISSKIPSNDKVASYKSSNTTVATVTSRGVVTAKKAGSATITVTMKSNAKATFKVTVKR